MPKRKHYVHRFSQLLPLRSIILICPILSQHFSLFQDFSFSLIKTVVLVILYVISLLLSISPSMIRSISCYFSSSFTFIYLKIRSVSCYFSLFDNNAKDTLFQHLTMQIQQLQFTISVSPSITLLVTYLEFQHFDYFRQILK